MKSIWMIALGVVGGLLAAGLILLLAQAPQGRPVNLMPPSTPAPWLVHVVGAVKNPGVYALPQGSRIQDAIQSAGGFLADADQGALNLAAFVEDGQRLSVPFLQPSSDSDSESLITGADRSTQVGPGDPEASPTITGPLNINSASQEELESLPGIGPVLAMNIIIYRQENGPFATIEDIQSVSGIGPKIFEKIKNFIISR